MRWSCAKRTIIACSDARALYCIVRVINMLLCYEVLVLKSKSIASVILRVQICSIYECVHINEIYTFSIYLVRKNTRHRDKSTDVTFLVGKNDMQ